MKIKCLNKYLILLTIVLAAAAAAQAQTTAFNYQGKLTDAGASQATYQMQFRLFDAASGGAQIGGTIENPSVAVEQGVFSVLLNFGANAFAGADRFLEIGVRRSAGENYTILNPRQQIASSPYSIRTLSAQQADLALNANQLGGIPANQYVRNSDVDSSFIRNGTALQTGNFNISGNGFFGGGVGIGTSVPNPFYKLDVFGPVQSRRGDSTHLVADTFGGTNSWARFYMRSSNPNGSLNQSWFMGTSRNFNGNQFYLADETGDQSRMTIQPNGGAISFPFGNFGIGTTTPNAGLELRGTGLQTQQRITDNSSGNSLVLQSGAGANMKVTGYNYNTSQAVPLYLSADGANTFLGGNVAQPRGNGGLPKAMLYVDFDGTIIRCYNGITGSSSGNCGFTVLNFRSGAYEINFGFPVNDRFLYVTSASNDRFATWASECLCPANTLLVDTKNNANVVINGRFVAILF